jgi:hypothetical protein
MSRYEAFSPAPLRPLRIFLAASCATLATVAFAACGGSVQSSDALDGGRTSGMTSGSTSGGTSGSTSGSSSGTTTSGGGDMLEPRCPSRAPSDGASCSSGFGVTCEYGGLGVDRECSTVAVCGGDAKWSTRTPDLACKGVQAQNEPACPSSYAELGAGEACPADVHDSCAYPEGQCECTPCSVPDAGPMGSGKRWSCARWPEPQSCPTPRPRIGSTCAVEGQDCNYVNFCEAVFLGLPEVKCVGGVWQAQEQFPPPCAFPRCSQ